METNAGKPVSRRNYCQQLASQLKEKYLSGNLEGVTIDILENLNELRSDEDFTSTWEPFLDFKNFTAEIACLLTDPQISTKLSGYSQDNAGKMLLKMLNFFERMQDKDMYMILLYHRLNDNCNDASEDELDWIAKFLKD